jgi:hypothetical protein
MSAQVTTIASGIVLLGLFVLVAWNLRRRRNGHGQGGAGKRTHGVFMAQAQDKSVDHQMINLYPKGPRPQTLTIKIGTPVVWHSHLAHTNRVVVTVAFLEGEAVPQATQPVEGINGFVLEGSHFVGRMEGNGGTFAHGLSTVVVLRKCCAAAAPVLPCVESPEHVM